MVLSGEDVAARPGNLSAKGSEGLDEDSSLNGCTKRLVAELINHTESFIHTHVQAASNTSTSKRLLFSVLFPGGHQTGHLNLGKLDFSAAERRQAKVSDLELLCWCAHVCICVMEVVEWMRRMGGNSKMWREKQVLSSSNEVGEIYSVLMEEKKC